MKMLTKYRFSKNQTLSPVREMGLLEGSPVYNYNPV